jgi:hypothetical protein
MATRRHAVTTTNPWVSDHPMRGFESSMKSRTILPLLFITVSLVPAAAFAGDRATSSARELAKQGLEAYDAGRYEEAAEKLGKAYEVVHVPTLAVNEARALVKLGRLVAASELYLEATRIQGEKSWQSTQFEAQKDAEKERAELLLRIPRLKVELKGTKAGEVKLTLDGSEVPSALLDEEQVVDPGERRIEGMRGSEVVKQSVTVKERDHAVVTLEFKRSSASATPGVGSASQKNNNESQTIAAISPLAAPQTIEQKQPSRAQSTVGWVTLSTGVAGLVLGGVTGLVGMSKRSSLRDSNTCSADGLHCLPSQASDVNAYNSLRTVSSVGFIAGGVLAVTGITLVLTAPKRESKPRVGLWVGPSSAGVYGGF